MLAAIAWMRSLCDALEHVVRASGDRVVHASPRTLKRALYGLVDGGFSRRVRITHGLPGRVLAMCGEPNEADDRCPANQAHRVRDGNDAGTPARVTEQVPTSERRHKTIAWAPIRS